SNTLLLRSNSKQQLMSIYPNPIVNNQVNIKLFEEPNTWVDVTIYDLIGAKVYYNRFNNRSTLISFKAPPSFSRETHYIIEVRFGATVAREQIIFR
ncbi:MAG TPA: T9SS type A sorting domain-containing protein, partial [Chitinophagaceae bacterium]|nr:T9SS type A sorting domain-containing protein [Chitinophagaceae bacterium]